MEEHVLRFKKEEKNVEALFLNVQNTVYNRLHLLKFVQRELECLSSLESQGFIIDHLLNEKSRSEITDNRQMYKAVWIKSDSI